MEAENTVIQKEKRHKRISSIQVQNILLKRDVSLFSKLDFFRFFHSISNRQISRLLYQAIEDGAISKVKRGLFFLTIKPPAAFEVANALCTPSYISLETALSYYRLIPENVYSIKSITTKHTKKSQVFNRDYSYSQINKNLFFGYKKVVISGKSIIIAEREKAFLDYLYFVVRGLKKLNDRLDLSIIDKSEVDKLLPYFYRVLKGKKLKTFQNIIKKYYDKSN